MIAAQFDYKRVNTLDEALSLLAQNEDAKILAGGHSLIPAMKLRPMQPPLLIDIGRIKDLAYIREEDGQIRIGAATTHYQIESSELLKKIGEQAMIFGGLSHDQHAVQLTDAADGATIVFPGFGGDGVFDQTYNSPSVGDQLIDFNQDTGDPAHTEYKPYGGNVIDVPSYTLGAPVSDVPQERWLKHDSALA